MQTNILELNVRQGWANNGNVSHVITILHQDPGFTAWLSDRGQVTTSNDWEVGSYCHPEMITEGGMMIYLQGSGSDEENERVLIVTDEDFDDVFKALRECVKMYRDTQVEAITQTTPVTLEANHVL